VDEADRLVALAASRGALLGVGHVERFGPAARALVERAGNPRFIECHRLAPFNPRGTDVPVVLDLMIHDIDMLLALAPGEIARVDAVGVPVLTPTADIANARIEFTGGLIANLTASRISMERMRKMRLFQPDAYMSLDFLEQKLEVYRKKPGAPGFVEAFAAAVAAGRPMDPTGWIQHESIVPAGEERLKTQLTAWVDAVLKGGPAPVSGEDGRRALRLADRIMQEMASAQ
jgi:predicted dehydrogenase